MTVTSLGDAVRLLQGTIRRLGTQTPIIVIDGQSGASKSTLARALVDTWPLDTGVDLVALDTLYPGWDGLAQGGALAIEKVILPHRQGRRGRWREWNWEENAEGAAVLGNPSLGLVVEGSGILTPSSAALSDLAVWLDVPAVTRKRRALARDGETYRPFWDRWAAQERAHIGAHQPQRLADLILHFGETSSA